MFAGDCFEEPNGNAGDSVIGVVVAGIVSVAAIVERECGGADAT